MHEQAYAVLDAIDRGVPVVVPEPEPWLKAVQTVRWAYPSENGFALTKDGRAALDDMRRRLAAQPRTSS